MRVKRMPLCSVIVSGLAAALVCFAAATACAQGYPCQEGFWTTNDGSLTCGRISEAWCGTPQQPGVTGNTINAMSWDGAALGQLWHFQGMTIDADGAVETGNSIDPTGFGYIDYVTNYEGGTFWLDGGYTWSDGTDLTGIVTLFAVGTRVLYVGFQPVAVTSNISVIGEFDQCELCTIEIVANSMRVWQTGDAESMPANYPPFLCGNSGELHETCCMTAQIICSPVSTDDASWGAIKTLYR